MASTSTHKTHAPDEPTDLIAIPGQLPYSSLFPKWFNKPPHINICRLVNPPEPGEPPVTDSLFGMEIKTATKTDYWQRTHYGFRFHNGHHFYIDVAGDWVLSTTVRSNPNSKYDQAGLMVRISESCWLKTSVEFQPGGGPSQLGAVVTNSGFSDWSTTDFFPSYLDDGRAAVEVSLRIRREGSDYIVEASLPPSSSMGATAGPTANTAIAKGGEPTGTQGWTQIRMARLLEDVDGCEVAAGAYACSPIGPGFTAKFDHLTIFAGRLKADA